MKNELFKGLLKSMYEMDRIVQGELEPGRVTRFTEPEVKQIRMIPVSARSNLPR